MSKPSQTLNVWPYRGFLTAKTWRFLHWPISSQVDRKTLSCSSCLVDLSFPQPNSSSVLLWYFGRTMMYAGLLKAPWSWVQMLRLVSPLAFPTLHTNPDSWNRWNMNDLLVSGKVCVKMTWCKGTLTCRLSMSNCQDVSVCSKCCHLFNSWLNSAVCHQSVHLPPSVSLLPPWSLISMMALASVWLSPSLTWWTEPTSSPLDCLC